MTNELTRRDILRGGAVGLGALTIPEWAIPALAQGEEVVEFTDYPDGWKTERGPETRFYDIRNIDGPYTPADEFFTFQHYGHPRVNGTSFRLKVTGLVDRPAELSLDDIKAMGETELVAGFECSGNSPRAMQALASNASWTGIPLKNLLDDVGVSSAAREIVFFGVDHGTETVEFRGRKYDVDQQFGRSIPVDEAMRVQPFIATGMNGAPLTVHQGYPLRLIVPGWYATANVKWLANVHIQQNPFLGKYQARWYRTLRGQMVDGEMRWTENAITRMRLKSVIARVSRMGDTVKVFGFVLNDGTPLRSVEIKVDDGAWQRASIDSGESKFAWKLFTYEWKGARPGEHTIVSRATDVTGSVQPTREDLANKKTFLEDNAQHPRKVMIS